MNIIFKFISFLLFLFLLTNCGSVEELSSTDAEISDLEACFVAYNDESELTKHLNYFNNLLEAPPDVDYYSYMNIVGCINYQLGNYSVAEERLKKSFQEAGEKDNAKYTAARALILIYLRNREKGKIVPAYVAAAEKADYGQWALIFYYIDNYRISGQEGYLSSAIKQIQITQQEEETTPTTENFLKHMQNIISMEDICKNDPERAVCLENGDLAEAKRYMFATAEGLLSMFLKEPPFNEKKEETPES